jgi:hypothetical protein
MGNFIYTRNFCQTLIHSIKEFMKENNLSTISLKDTIFEKKGRWKELFLNENNELRIKHHSCEYIPFEFEEDFEFINSLDIVNLIKIVYDKVAQIK